MKYIQKHKLTLFNEQHTLLILKPNNLTKKKKKP